MGVSASAIGCYVGLGIASILLVLSAIALFILRRDKWKLLEKNLLLSHENDEFSRDKESLSKEKAALVEEKDKLSAENSMLLKEKSKVSQADVVLSEEKEKVSQANAVLVEEKDRLSKEKEKVSQANAVLVEERDKASKVSQEKLEACNSRRASMPSASYGMILRGNARAADSIIEWASFFLGGVGKTVQERFDGQQRTVSDLHDLTVRLDRLRNAIEGFVNNKDNHNKDDNGDVDRIQLLTEFSGWIGRINETYIGFLNSPSQRLEGDVVLQLEGYNEGATGIKNALLPFIQGYREALVGGCDGESTARWLLEEKAWEKNGLGVFSEQQEVVR